MNELVRMHACTLIRKSAILAGIYEEGFSAHALRRFFQTSLEHAGVNPNWIKRMMGHAMNGVEGSYSKPEIEMLKEAYGKAYSHLAVSESVEYTARVETLERQVEKLTLNGKRREESLTGLLNLIEMIKEGLKSASEMDEYKIEFFDALKKLLVNEQD